MANAARNSEEHYVVLHGCETYVSSYVNKGEPVFWGDVIKVGPMMRSRLCGNMRIDPRTNEPASYFRDATDKEIDDYIHRLENIDPNTGDPRLLGEAARMEAIAKGHVEEGEMKEVRRREEEEEGLQPTRKRARKRSGNSED